MWPLPPSNVPSSGCWRTELSRSRHRPTWRRRRNASVLPLSLRLLLQVPSIMHPPITHTHTHPPAHTKHFLPLHRPRIVTHHPGCSPYLGPLLPAPSVGVPDAIAEASSPSAEVGVGSASPSSGDVARYGQLMRFRVVRKNAFYHRDKAALTPTPLATLTLTTTSRPLSHRQHP